MIKKLIIEKTISCGKDTCASSPGIFCGFVRTSKFGMKYHCGLFDNANLTHSDRDKDGDGLGWLQRLPQCKEAEKAGEEHSFYVPHQG